MTVSGEAGRLLDGGDLKGAAALVRVIEFDRQPPGWKGNESRFPRTSIKQVATEDTSTTPPTTRVFFNHASDAPNRACTLTFWKTENEVFKDQVLRIEEKQGRRAVRTIVTIIKRDKWDESVWSRNPAYESDDDDVAYDAIMVVCPKTPTAPEVVKSCTDHCDRVVATLAKN